MAIQGKKIDELLEEWRLQAEWDKAHPVRAFVRDIPGFFIYVIPRKFNDMRCAIRWGFQRAFRGYDDPYVWDFHYHHAKMTMDALKKLREIKHGSPYVHDPDGVLPTPAEPDVANETIHQRYDEALALMIRGFEAIQEADDVHELDADGKYDPEATKLKYNALIKEWEVGMKLFVANYAGLWD